MDRTPPVSQSANVAGMSWWITKAVAGGDRTCPPSGEVSSPQDTVVATSRGPSWNRTGRLAESGWPSQESRPSGHLISHNHTRVRLINKDYLKPAVSWKEGKKRGETGGDRRGCSGAPCLN